MWETLGMGLHLMAVQVLAVDRQRSQSTAGAKSLKLRFCFARSDVRNFPADVFNHLEIQSRFPSKESSRISFLATQSQLKSY
jgi:hypothetical protein